MLRERISHVGQQYVDDPAYTYPKMPGKVELAVKRAFDSEWEIPQPIQTHHDRVMLRWIKPA